MVSNIYILNCVGSDLIEIFIVSYGDIGYWFLLFN